MLEWLRLEIILALILVIKIIIHIIMTLIKIRRQRNFIGGALIRIKNRNKLRIMMGKKEVKKAIRNRSKNWKYNKNKVK